MKNIACLDETLINQAFNDSLKISFFEKYDIIKVLDKFSRI